MKQLRLNITICLVLLVLSNEFTTVVKAHHPTVGEVLEILNRDEIKSRYGIQEARVDPKLKRLLIIRVNKNWYNLPAEQRRKLAAAWLAMWKDALKDGIVSVVDAGSNEPVVNYGPAGRVDLTKR